MSLNIKYQKVKNGINVDITCDRCGGPITSTGPNGMRCDKDCYKKDDEKARKQVEKLMNEFFGLKLPSSTSKKQ